jgi:hypothetical protein
VRILYVLGLILAGCMFIGGFTASILTHSPMGIAAGLVVSILMILGARLFKEASLMAADASDSLIRLAERS